MVGWAFFPYGGVISAFQTISFSAHAMQDMANTTADAISLLQKGMEKIRTSVVQHQMVLELLTVKDGGICRILNTSCFYIPAYKQSISNRVQHMRQIVPKPPPDTWNP